MKNNPQTENDERDSNNFNWLKRACRGPTYTSYFQFSHLPSCAFDWGEDGYAGRSNQGGELLYLSAPSQCEGLIMARGHFATSLYASLSRSQIEFGGPSTFGLEVSKCPYAYDPEGKVITEEDMQNESTSKKILGAKNGSSYRLGSMIDRGCFNYRWPVTEYYLDLHPDQRAVEREKKERCKKLDEDAKKDEQNDTQDITQDKHGIKGNEKNFKASAQCISQVAQGAEDGNRSNKKNTRFTSQGQLDTKEENRSDKKVTRFASQDESSTKEKKENDKKDQSPPKHVGTCQMFSCAKGDMFYQVLRIEEGGEFGMKFRHNSQIILTVGGPVWFQCFNDGEHEIVSGHGRTMMSRGDSVSVPTDKSQDPQEPVEKTEIVLDKSEHEPTGSIIRYWDPCGRGLEAKVYQLQDGEYKQLCMTKSPWEADNGPKYEEGSTELTAYNAIGELQNLPITSKGSRSVTFLAAIRLYEGDENGGDRNGFGRWPEDLELPTSEELFDHVGVDPDHDIRGIATGAMWESIFLDRRVGPAPVLELAEFNMIGRSLEKILQVDIIPITIDDDDENDEGDGKIYAALVSNLFVRENVDLKSLFWKIRFLIRTHKFLSHIHKLDQSSSRSKGGKQEIHLLKPDQSSTQNKPEVVKSIEEFQMERIQTKVENVIRYLAKVLLDESLANSRTRVMPERHVPGESNYYYVMITIWYVWKYFKEQFKDVPDWKLEWTGRVQLANLKRNNPVLYAAKRLPSDNWAFAKADREKVALLQWYHYGSLLNLCKDGILSESWLQSDLTSLERKVARLAKAAKMVSSAKLSSRESYVADDEIFDRLSFVSDELGLENLQSSNDIGIIESLAMSRVKQRDFTRSLNTGWLPKDDEESTSGPWEIHALCHHSRLVVLTKEEKSKQDWRTEKHTKAEAEIFRQKICTFLNAEGTLNPSWERAHAKARKAWLRSETTAVAASTLIIILEKKIRAKSSGSSVLVGNASERFSTEEAMTEGTLISNVPVGNTSSKQTQTEQAGLDLNPSEQSLLKISEAVKAHNDQIGRDQKKLLLEVLHLEDLTKGQLEAFERFTNESGLLPPIQWTLFRPGRKYHPLSFFNSLEDTPELYKAEEIGKATVPLSLCDRISSPAELKIQGKEFTKRDIAIALPKECLVLFDIKAAGKEEDDEGYTWEIEQHKYDKAKKESEDSFLWALYDSLVDQEVQHRFLTVVPEKDWEKKLKKNPDNNADKKSDWNALKKSKKSDKKPRKDPGKDSDSDSDKTAEKKLKKPCPIPREVLELLVYVIHPESAPCLGDHVLNLSNFSYRSGDTWVASISLRSWRVESEPVKKDKKGERIETYDNLSDTSQEDFHDFHDFRLPLNLKQVWDQNEGVDEDTVFKPEVSSIILSTNSFGDFSKCTVVSGLFPNDKRDEEMESIVKDSRKLWQKFIHQPQTARCLVFFLVLGKFCHEITDHYEKAISKLSLILKLDSTFTNTEDEYPPEFELGVWSLDALYRLQNSLNATVDSLQRAKEELTAQIIDGPGKRGVKLERMCQDYLGAFENNLVQLTAVSVKLNRRIELNTRNKDATSAVLTMRDSRTAISQNSTIQKLTYLTIGYLPMALMSAIFAIPPEQNVLFPPMSFHGRSWFVGAIFMLSVATYVLAIFIGNVLDFFRYPPPRPGEVGKKPRSEDPPNIWKWIYLPEFLHWLGHFFRAIGHLLLQIIKENTPNSPDKKPEEPTSILTNDERSMEEGKAKAIAVETRAVSNGDETRNGAVKP